MEQKYRNNVLGIIFNQEGKILIGKYNTSKPNWTFPKGGMENNETIESVIFREIYEELGINPDKLEIIYYYKNEFIKDFTQEEIEWKIKNKGECFVGKKEKILLIRYKGSEFDINLNISNEFSEYRFVEVLDIPNYINNIDLIKFINLDVLKNKINELSLKFIPYNGILKNFPLNGVFFVGLSHKLGKDGNVLEAFCDKTNSGKIITDITSICGLDGIYKTNLVKGVPLNANKKIRYPNEQEKNDGIDILVKEIDLFKPRLVFLFGKQVSDFVLKKLNSIKISENEFRYGETILVLTEHPSYITVYKRKQIDIYISGIIDRLNEKV